MKTWLLIAITFVNFTLSCAGDEKYIVNLGNWDEPSRPVYFLKPGGVIPTGQTFYFQLLGGPVGGQLGPVTEYGYEESVFPIDATGHFDAGTGIVPGVQGRSGLPEPVAYRLEVWGPGPDKNQAQYYATTSQFIGMANAFDPAVVGSSVPVAAILILPESPILMPIPEPSAYILLLGGAILIVLRLRSMN